MERRTLLKIGLAATAGTILLSVVGYRESRPSTEDLIESILQHYIGDENLAVEAASRFAKDVTDRNDGELRRILRSSPRIGSYDSWRDSLPRETQGSLDAYEREIITLFIQSSDIAENPRELTKPIDYIALTEVPACNPFARLRV